MEICIGRSTGESGEACHLSLEQCALHSWSPVEFAMNNRRMHQEMGRNTAAPLVKIFCKTSATLEHIRDSMPQVKQTRFFRESPSQVTLVIR